MFTLLDCIIPLMLQISHFRTSRKLLALESKKKKKANKLLSPKLLSFLEVKDLSTGSEMPKVPCTEKQILRIT